MRALVLAFLVLAACERPAPEVEPVPPPPVHVDVVRTRQVVPTAEGVATLEAARDATLRAEVGGRVVDLAAALGSRVEVGASLVRLDVGRTAVALDAVGAQVAQAEAALAQAERQRELAERLVQSGGAASTRLDDATDGVRLAQAALEATRAQQRLTRRGITEAVVRAPFAGIVAERFVEVGELAAPGAPVMRLVDVSHLKATVLLDPREALDLVPGARGHAEVHAREGERFDVTVERVGELVDPRTRRLPVEVRIDDPQHRLRPGLTARVRVETGPARAVVVLPSGALFERFGETQVYVVDGEAVAHRRTVSAGTSRDGEVEIGEGLTPNERVVVAGVERVVHERPVQVVERHAEEAASERAPRDVPEPRPEEDTGGS
ncbi:MAG: efflux RND transporter periplasmic adaptor subunit [Sandaracinus sp.]|nr:efflux RND transporter periplasmic adaptor subunit [Sandaracinus sp.]MCB9634127.1 efflux RND transporter periplasmic adaptor subunit [Sandaracinus sp.]